MKSLIKFNLDLLYPWVLKQVRMQSKRDFNYYITQDILQIANIVNLLDDAARTRKIYKLPKGPSVPSMYDVLITSYDKSDIGYYQKQIKLRATPRQITRWEFAMIFLCWLIKTSAIILQR